MLLDLKVFYNLFFLKMGVELDMEDEIIVWMNLKLIKFCIDILGFLKSGLFFIFLGFRGWFLSMWK